MLYKCEHCNYTTKRIRDLNRHINRKNPCYTKNKVEVCNLEEERNNNPIQSNVNAVQSNVNAVQSNVNAIQSNVNAVQSNVNANNKPRFQCSKCSKILSSNQNLKSHEEKCDGVDPKQCRICLKVFTTRQGKSQHIRYVKCSPPIQTNYK